MKEGVMDTFRQCEGGYAADHVKEIVEEATIEEHLSESDEEQELYEEFVVYDETLYLDNLVTDENPAYAASNNSEDILTIDFVKPSSERSASPTVTSHTIRKKASKPSIKFHCVECRKEFSTKTNLQRHQATHNGNKPFQCDICSKGFTQSGSLKTHRFTHLNIKPHACTWPSGITQAVTSVWVATVARDDDGRKINLGGAIPPTAGRSNRDGPEANAAPSVGKNPLEAGREKLPKQKRKGGERSHQVASASSLYWGRKRWHRRIKMRPNHRNRESPLEKEYLK
uniref:C2H2-type domain-containing protein n=1 Tax=Anopheles atroparvus TaxID=41427 RepID=A0A182IW88_ANOAO